MTSIKFHRSDQSDQNKQPCTIAMILKGWPRLSETFIAQEFLALQQRGVAFQIWSLRRPYDAARHPMHSQITAEVHYLPEYLYQEPLRLLKGFTWAVRQPRFGTVLRAWFRDLLRDRTPNRGRRFGQALIMARELDSAVDHLHVHYLHTPASVTRYCAILRGLPWSFSAHAKDIWTIPDWEKREKIADAAWGVTCTRTGRDHLAALSPAGLPRVSLAYHGLDLSRFPAPPEGRPARNGRDPSDPVRIATIGRAVAKKGFDDLLAALTLLPADLHWRLSHIGGGELLKHLKQQADSLGLGARIDWLGSRPQGDVIATLAASDIFVLPSRPAPDGDRDGLPNVLMEAASQRLAIVSTDFAGIPEFVTDGEHGLLVAPEDRSALAGSLVRLARDPALRKRLGEAAETRLRTAFDMKAGIDLIEDHLTTHRHTDADRLLRPDEDPRRSDPLGRSAHGTTRSEGAPGGGA